MRIVVALVGTCVSVHAAGAAVCFTSGGHAICGESLERCESLRTRELMRVGGAALPACAESTIALTEATSKGKDPGAAIGLSIGVTAIGLALITMGASSTSGHGTALAIGGGGVLLFGPSTGHFYAEHPGTVGLAFRAGGLALAGIFMWCGVGGDSAPDRCSTGVAGGFLLAGAIGVVAGTISDFATAGDAARDYNRVHGLDMTIGPTAIRTPTATLPGLGVVGRF